MKGNIFNIQRFSTGDGPGIRTTVFMKGCPLHCAWCHNPESQSAFTEILYNSEKCISCGMCEKICQQGQHIFNSDEHIFLRNNCELCMKCVENCPVGTFEHCGKEMTVENVVSEILRDEEFYKQSGGGITLSGGEPLFQYEFSLELLKEVKQRGIHTAIETSGYCDKHINEICQYVDLWLYDIKTFSKTDHIKYTGVSNEKILKNLYLLDGMGTNIILRCPIIPKINFFRNHFDEIAILANKLHNVVEIHLEPYHPLGIDKSKRLGKVQKYKNQSFLSETELLPFADYLKSKTNIAVEVM